MIELTLRAHLVSPSVCLQGHRPFSFGGHRPSAIRTLGNSALARCDWCHKNHVIGITKRCFSSKQCHRKHHCSSAQRPLYRGFNAFSKRLQERLSRRRDECLSSTATETMRFVPLKSADRLGVLCAAPNNAHRNGLSGREMVLYFDHDLVKQSNL